MDIILLWVNGCVSTVIWRPVSAQPMRVDELTPRSSRVSMAVKVLSMDEPRDIESGGCVCEGLVGDETGTIVMSFWNEECDQVAVDATIWLKDARATLVRGSLRSEERRVGKECRSRWSP